MKKIKIICTLGPKSFNKKVLNKLKSEKVDIFRINLSHTPKHEIEKKINYLKKNKIKNICIDTEGAQIRTSFIKKNVFLKRKSIVKVFNTNINSTKKKIYLLPKFKMSQVSKNSTIDIGFNSLQLKVLGYNKKENFLRCMVTKEGILGANKGVHLSSKLNLPALTEKDKFALELANKKKIKFLAISFVNYTKDIELVKEVCGSKKFIISKIETLNALKNLRSIAKKSNAMLIDRGDLSRYVPIEEIPLIQKKILQFSKKNKFETYVATNLLETMIKENQPTRAESHDIYSTIIQGAKGLVLAAETAVGVDPVNCVKFLKRCINVFDKKDEFRL